MCPPAFAVGRYKKEKDGVLAMALFGLFGSGGSKDTDKTSDFHVTGRDVFRYTHMPQILPRIRAIGQKLGHFSFMLALVFRSTRLLPNGHPMLNPANIGRYGIRDVIATAANGLVMKRENIDQIFVFGAVVAAMIMIVVQAFAIAMYAFLGSAHANANVSSSSMFTTPNPDTDLVFQFLRQVFGVETIFGDNSISHPGFHAILGFYSTAMMIVAVIIVVYYVVTVVGESAQTGTPFGKRFNGLWAPVRLVLALGLLVPLGGGLNAAQYLTLNVAKLGSSLATKGWIVFSDHFGEADIGRHFRAPSAAPIANLVFAAETCMAGYNQVHAGSSAPVGLRMNIGNRSYPAGLNGSDITQALAAGVHTITYVWSAHNPSDSSSADPTCGGISFNLTSSSAGTGTLSAADQVARQLQEGYLGAISGLIDAIGASGGPAELFAQKTIATNGISSAERGNISFDTIASGLASATDQAQTAMNNAVGNIDLATDDVAAKMKLDAIERGWGTAGIYYLEMAKATQLYLDIVNSSYPTPVMAPADVEHATFGERFWGVFGYTAADDEIRASLAQVNDVINTASSLTTVQVNLSTTSNPQGAPTAEETVSDQSGVLLFLVKLMFGDGFLRLLDEPTLNPMSALISAGSDILNRVKWSVGLYVATEASGGIAGRLATGAIMGTAATASPVGAVGGAVAFSIIATVLHAVSPIFFALIFIGVSAGVVLFYLLPLMPMMYFFFSVVNWVIEVAEAFVSMPLFALSHLRIDGDGLPGQTAYQGWLILFGVLLRPIMIIMGLIVGSLVFNAGAFYLGQIYKYGIFAYNTDVQGAAGLDFSKLSAFAIVTYVILYVYLIYMLANASFKLIDQIPDKMMRWIGGSTPFTGDRPVDLGNMQNIAIGGYLAMKEAGGAAKGGLESLRPQRTPRPPSGGGVPGGGGGTP